MLVFFVIVVIIGEYRVIVKIEINKFMIILYLGDKII